MSVEKEITQQEPSGSIYSKIYNFFLLEDLQKDAVKSKHLYLISTKDLRKFHDCIKYASLKELKANKEKEFNQKSIEDYYKENNINLKPLDGDTKIKIIEKTEEKEGMENMEIISEIVVEILQSIGYEIEIIKKEEQNKQDETKDNKNEPKKDFPQEQAKSETKDVNKTEEQIKQEKEEEKKEQEKKGEEIQKEEEPKKDELKADKTNKEEEKEKINEKPEDKDKKEGEVNKEKEKDGEKPKENKEDIKKEDEHKTTNENEEKKTEEQKKNPPQKEEINKDEANDATKKQEEAIKPNEGNKPTEEKKEEDKKDAQANNAQNIPQKTNLIQNNKVESPSNENNDPPKQENNPSTGEKKDEEKKEPPKQEEKEQKSEKVEDNSDPKNEQTKEADTLNIDEKKEENKKDEKYKECIKEIKKDEGIINKVSDNTDKSLLNKKVNREKDDEQNEQEIALKKNKIEEPTKQEEEKNEIQKEQNEIKNPGEIQKEQNEIKNPEEIQKEQNNENVNANQLTPEQMLFIQQQMQMQQQMMIQKYFMENGWENNFINNYLLNIPANSEEPDDGLPHAKNGIIQLDSDKPTLGLQNVGATCYMNATLECLIHMKELSQLLLSAFFFKYPKENKDYAEKHKLTLSYINILSQVFFPKLNGNTSKYYAPYEFKNLISELNPLFQGVQANDAKDLLQCILENLHTELKMATQYFQEYNIDQRDEKASMQYFFNSYVTQNKSPIQDYLYGINRIKSICLKCNTAKYNFQTYNLLYFPLKEAKRVAVLRKKKEDEKFDEKNYILNLEDCFAHSEQVDHFTGDNQMFCNECQSSADAEYQTVLYTTPTILSIVLNRGKANLDFQENFEFGLDLDIKKYIYNPEAKHGKYYLIGMVVHSGLHGMGGHFIAYCRMDKKAKWFCYNDAWVTECNDIEKKLSENSPYILFYHYDTDYNNENKENKEAQK